MTDVRMPDGVVVRFPDTMPADQIKAMIAQKFPDAVPQQTVEAPADDRGFMTRVDDFGRGMADMMSFGTADELSAGANSLIGSGSYDQNVKAERDRDATGGWERFGGQFAGAMMLPGKLALSIPSAIAKGALGGGLYGLGSGEGNIVERAPSAAVGALAGGAAGGAVRGIANRLQTRAAAKAIPTNEELKTAASAAYKVADDSGVIFKPEGIRRLNTEIKADLADFGYHPKLQPRVAVVLEELETLQNGNLTFKGADVLRRIADGARKSPDPSEQELGRRIIDHIDDFMVSASPDEVLTGNAAAAGDALKSGRDLWGRLRKSERVDVAALKADRRAASTGSGGNLDNALRQNVRAMLDNAKTARGMSEAEKAAAETVVRGGRGQNALRLAGKLSPQGNGLMAALGIGGTMVNPAFGVASLTGMAAKTVADHMTVKNAARLSQIIRSGGKSAKDLAALARGGELDIGQIHRIEKLAQMLGVPVPQLAAAVAERMN